MKEQLIEELFSLIKDMAPRMRKGLSGGFFTCRGLKLSPHQQFCFMIISKHDSISMGGLAELLGVSNQQLTRIVDFLVKNNLAERYNDPSNRRTVLVRLTAYGHDIEREMHNPHKELFKERLNNLSEDELKEIINHLTALKEIVGKIIN